MTCYGRKPLLDNRYQLLATSSIYTSDDEKLISYVEFLRYDIKLSIIFKIVNDLRSRSRFKNERITVNIKKLKFPDLSLEAIVEI